MSRVQHGGGVILMSFIMAVMLTLVPLPDWAAHLRPAWVAMVLIYWCMALPVRVGVGTGWLAGLFLDVVNGALLGQYALALALIAWVTHSLHQRLRLYPVWQQSLVVLLLLLLQQLLVIWVRGFIGQSPDTLLHWLPAFTSMLLWPWLFVILRDVRRRYRVS
jgi:rod shape-determining protein MreD